LNKDKEIRDTIFIGHATPEDNEFTLWLQSKLRNEGYKCECDLSLLLGGESDYWNTLQEFLEEKCIKYILVVSEVTFKKGGVLDEWEHCKSLEKELELTDFIIPVKIDGSPYNSRIGLNRRNIISFGSNWATGLKRLLKKIINDNIPHTDGNPLSISAWYNNVYTNYLGLDKENKDEFFSNWIQIPQLPKKIFFHKFANVKQAKAVLENTFYPAYRHGNQIVSFESVLDTFIPVEQLKLNSTEVIESDLSKAFEYYESESFPKFGDLRRLLSRLLNVSLEKYLKSKNLQIFELSSSKCFYYTHSKENKVKGNFQLGEKSKKIGLTGKYFDDFWHYGISFRCLLSPELCFSLKNHIVFSEDGEKLWNNPKKSHSARRRKGKNFHNKEWRDLFLSFLSTLSNDNDGKIIIPLSNETNLILSSTPIKFISNFSYAEPNDENRIIPIDDYLEDEDFYNKLEEE
jgi:hypothetical protein